MISLHPQATCKANLTTNHLQHKNTDHLLQQIPPFFLVQRNAGCSESFSPIHYQVLPIFFPYFVCPHRRHVISPQKDTCKESHLAYGPIAKFDYKPIQASDVYRPTEMPPCLPSKRVLNASYGIPAYGICTGSSTQTLLWQ